MVLATLAYNDVIVIPWSKDINSNRMNAEEDEMPLLGGSDNETQSSGDGS